MADYPTDEELSRVSAWPESDPAGWFAYIKGLWWAADWGFSQSDARYSMSTGGWSGNESIISAMRENGALWGPCYLTCRRGGHYCFGIP